LEFWRKPITVGIIGVLVTIVLVVTVVIVLLLTGNAKTVSNNAALIGALAGLGGVFTTQMVTSALEDQRRREARNTEANRTQEARDIEERRARAAALQAYLDRMGNLLGEKGVRDKPDERALARAHTLAVLEGLDPKRKRVVVQFLRESNLIPREVPGKQDKIVALSGANLTEADLSELDLEEARLAGAFLDRANLRKAHLPHADLGGTRLHGADLTGANLSGASLWNAQLQSKLDLRLEAANLSGANLSGADLRGAELGKADLHDAIGITNEKLEQQASSLEGTIMPDGSKHP
jgi:uncharacterized protein YjbI with pentapeptide repeats